MRKWIRGWNPRGKDWTWRGWNPRGKDGTGEDGIVVEKMGQGRMESSWKGGKVLAAIFGEFAWHSVIDGIDAFF
jgi:hypothetical protein